MNRQATWYEKKASKLLTLKQRKKMWGEYVHLNIKKKLGYNFEEFLTKILPLE
jgi:hypothetical protein